MSMKLNDHGARAEQRSVGALLGIGILLMPYVFAWFLLRRGYSRRARLIGFGWMAVVLVGLRLSDSGSSSSVSAATQQSATDPRTASQSFTDALLDPQMKSITDKVARDAVDQYNIARNGGDKGDICLHAGMVAAAYLQAKDEANYLLWKTKRRNDCDAAGMPSGQD